MDNITLRHSNPSDAQKMTEITRRSKAYWGYSEALLDAWKKDLTVTPEFLENAVGFVIERDGVMIAFGVQALIQSDQPTNGFLFIEPEYIGHGYGTLLFNVLRDDLKKKGIQSITFEADPHALDFYLKLGCQKIGEKESTVIPGRMFPIMRIIF